MKKYLILIGLCIVLGLFSAIALGLWAHLAWGPEAHARKTLDKLLGEATVAEPPHAADLLTPYLSPDMPADLFSEGPELWLEDWPMVPMPNQLTSTIQMPKIDVNETPEAYVITVPLSQPDDEKNVKLKVEPYFISVSAQLPLRSPDGNSVLGSSSFMRSFHTRQEILPAKMSRKVNDNTLVVTIPKKVPDDQTGLHLTPPSQNQGKQTPVPNTDLQRKLRSQPQSFI